MVVPDINNPNFGHALPRDRGVIPSWYGIIRWFKDQPPPSFEVNCELPFAIVPQWMWPTSDEIGHTSRRHQIREAGTQLLRAGGPKLAFLSAFVGTQGLQIIVRE